MVCTGRLLLLYWGFEAIFFWKNWSFKGSLRILPHETLPIWLEAVSTEERWESPNKLFPSMNVKVLTTKPLTLGRSWHLFTLPPFKFTRFCCVINNLVPKNSPKVASILLLMKSSSNGGKSSLRHVKSQACFEALFEGVFVVSWIQGTLKLNSIVSIFKCVC